ncbi:MAG: hypothetical protein DWB42_12985, partial [Chloroflexi bacterium]|nr:hypothetical protein [Chloroflexota bacterium]
RLQKVLPLFGRRLKFDLSSQFHALSITQTIVYFQALNLVVSEIERSEGAFLHPLKQVVSCAKSYE